MFGATLRKIDLKDNTLFSKYKNIVGYKGSFLDEFLKQASIQENDCFQVNCKAHLSI